MRLIQIELSDVISGGEMVFWLVEKKDISSDAGASFLFSPNPGRDITIGQRSHQRRMGISDLSREFTLNFLG